MSTAIKRKGSASDLSVPNQKRRTSVRTRRSAPSPPPSPPPPYSPLLIFPPLPASCPVTSSTSSPLVSSACPWTIIFPEKLISADERDSNDSTNSHFVSAPPLLASKSKSNRDSSSTFSSSAISSSYSLPLPDSSAFEPSTTRNFASSKSYENDVHFNSHNLGDNIAHIEPGNGTGSSQSSSNTSEKQQIGNSSGSGSDSGSGLSNSNQINNVTISPNSNSKVNWKKFRGKLKQAAASRNQSPSSSPPPVSSSSCLSSASPVRKPNIQDASINTSTNNDQHDTNQEQQDQQQQQQTGGPVVFRTRIVDVGSKLLALSALGDAGGDYKLGGERLRLTANVFPSSLLPALIYLDNPLQTSITFGRGVEANIKLDSKMHPYVISRKHATIRRDPNFKYTLIDEESKTGCFVNDVKVKKAVLNFGDVIRFGGPKDCNFGDVRVQPDSEFVYTFEKVKKSVVAAQEEEEDIVGSGLDRIRQIQERVKTVLELGGFCLLLPLSYFNPTVKEWTNPMFDYLGIEPPPFYVVLAAVAAVFALLFFSARRW